MARKAPGESWEAYADRQVREAQARGEFDGLAGEGRPLADLHRPRDANWWIKRKLEDEEFVAVPPAIALRLQVEAARARIADAPSEAAVRAIVDDVNAHIRHANATIVSGPPSTVWPLDAERAVQRWRAAHPQDPDTDAVPDAPDVPDPPAAHRWRRAWDRVRGRASATGDAD